MPQPGWYADPDGTPQRLRYWDGQNWTPHVAPMPPAGGPLGPPPSSGPTDPLPPGAVRAPSSKPRRPRWLVPAVLVIVAALIAGGMGIFMALQGLRGRTAPDPIPRITVTPGPGNPSMPAPFPTPAGTASATPGINCPTPAPRTLTDGHLSAKLPGKRLWHSVKPPAWLVCAQRYELETQIDYVYVELGRMASPAPGADAREVAEQVAQLALLDAASTTVQEHGDSLVVIDGKEAAEVHYVVGDGPQDVWEVFSVAAVQAPDGSFSVIVTNGTDDDEEGMSALDEVVETLKVG